VAFFEVKGEEVWEPMLLRIANVQADTASKGENKFSLMKYDTVQVREESPILYSHKTQLNIKLSLLQHYNMFRPKLSAIFRLYMKPI